MGYLIIFLVICYIAFIHFKLNSKNHLIEEMVVKLSKIEKDWDSKYILNLIEKQRLLQANTILSRNKLFDEPVLKFLFANENNSKIFVHYTKDEYTAKKISKEGLLFTNTFDKTAEEVFNDSVDLTYKHNIRKYFGKYIVVICIPNDIYKHYSMELTMLNSNSQPEQILSGIPSFLNDNQDEVFTLSKKFIRGYINYEAGTFVKNSEFRSTFKSFATQGQLN